MRSSLKRLFVAPLCLAVTLTAQFASAAEPVYGLQLYSLRGEFKKNVTAALDLVKGYNVKEVELAGLNNLPAAEYLPMLTSRSLQPISGHWQFNEFTKDPAAVIAAAKAMGVKYIVCPWIPHTIAEFSEADVKKAAEAFNTFGEACAKEGLKFAYHPHGYEFKPAGDGTLFDQLVTQTKPEFVAFEMDVFWVVQPGQDPVKLLEKYPTRWIALHIKDLRKGARTGVYTGHAPTEDNVPVGTGMVNWPSVLKTAQKLGVQHYFIEDETASPLESVPASLQYLRSLKISQ